MSFFARLGRPCLGLRHLTFDLFLHGRRSIEEKAPFRILDLQDKQVDEHGHRRDRENDQPGPYQGRGNDNEWGEKYAAMLGRIMGTDLTVIKNEYDRACQLEYPGGVSGQSWDDADRFWMGLRASFPNAEFKIEHQIGREDPLMPPRAALRWTLEGKHEGWGAFGKPTGAEVFVLGAAHAEFGPWGLRREYVLFDETAIWKQIILKTG